jgi:hypothetical protein
VCNDAEAAASGSAATRVECNGSETKRLPPQTHTQATNRSDEPRARGASSPPSHGTFCSCYLSDRRICASMQRTEWQKIAQAKITNAQQQRTVSAGAQWGPMERAAQTVHHSAHSLVPCLLTCCECVCVCSVRCGVGCVVLLAARAGQRSGAFSALWLGIQASRQPWAAVGLPNPVLLQSAAPMEKQRVGLATGGGGGGGVGRSHSAAFAPVSPPTLALLDQMRDTLTCTAWSDKRTQAQAQTHAGLPRASVPVKPV